MKKRSKKTSKKSTALPIALSVILSAALLVIGFFRLNAAAPQTQPEVTPAPTPTAAAQPETETETAEPEPTPEEPDDPRPQILWDSVTEKSFSGLDELNAKLGTKLARPDCFSAEDTSYTLISCRDYDAAEYTFVFDGQSFTLRAAPTREDISGIYDGAPLFTDESGDMIVTDTVKAARWFYNGFQYCLTAEDSAGFDTEYFYTLTDDLNALSF